MNLRRHHYVSDYVNGQSGARKNNLYAIQGINVDPAKVCKVIEEVAYWRKANQIHNWFVENVQGGNDDCGSYYVDTEKLEALLGIVNEVLDSINLIDGQIINGYTIENGNKKFNYEDGQLIEDSSIAQKLLPTSEGFFFGSTEYDEYYYQDLVYTKQILEEILAREEIDDYYYHSSW